MADGEKKPTKKGMRITKVYTRGGDEGQTSLVNGPRVAKDHPRVEAYGTVDELNTIVGLVRMELARANVDKGVKEHVDGLLARVQNDLFNLGSDLATRVENRWEGIRLMGEVDSTRLEAEIDVMNEDLGPLIEFILPGGGPVGAFLHQARTVCRRAERRGQTLGGIEEINPGTIVYLNRLSDWLFVAGRWVAKQVNEPEFLWDRTT